MGRIFFDGVADVPDQFDKTLHGLLEGRISVDSPERQRLLCYYALLNGATLQGDSADMIDYIMTGDPAHPFEPFVHSLCGPSFDIDTRAPMDFSNLTPREMYEVGCYAACKGMDPDLCEASLYEGPSVQKLLWSTLGIDLFTLPPKLRFFDIVGSEFDGPAIGILSEWHCRARDTVRAAWLDEGSTIEDVLNIS